MQFVAIEQPDQPTQIQARIMRAIAESEKSRANLDLAAWNKCIQVPVCLSLGSAGLEKATTSSRSRLTDRSLDIIVCLDFCIIFGSLFQSLLVELLHLLVFGVGSSHASLVAEWITVVVDLIHANIKAIIVEEGISDAFSIRISISISIGRLFLGLTSLGRAWCSFLWRGASFGDSIGGWSLRDLSSNSSIRVHRLSSAQRDTVLLLQRRKAVGDGAGVFEALDFGHLVDIHLKKT
jgi:hypothetical protein